MNSVYVCSNCRYRSPFYLADCPRCGQGTFSDAAIYEVASASSAAAPAIGEDRTCYKCDFETNQILSECPRCGKRLRTAEEISSLGWALVIIGGSLTGLMGAITIGVTYIISQAGKPGSGFGEFKGGTKELALIYGIFGLVLSFGIIAIVAGVYQIMFGKRNKKLVRVMLVIVVVLLVVGELVQIFL
jgi:RNA polymerase subunit RPABC4/transcription elongation factor Spt4